MATQRKEVGTQVDFANGAVIKDFKKICYAGDNIGVLLYQQFPVTVDASVRDMCFNGDIGDVATQINGQGMLTKYGVISWNETLQGDGRYYITDFRIGVVVQVVRDYNTGAEYIVDALKAVPWLGQIMAKISLPLQAWELLPVLSKGVIYHQFVQEMVSEIKWVSFPVAEPPPPLPTATEVKATIDAQADFQTAIGTFTTKMLEKSVSVTILPPWGVDVCFYRSPVGMAPGSPYNRAYYYRVYVRFRWDCTTIPDITVEPSLLPITLPVIIAIILAVGVVIAGSIATYNLTHTVSWYRKYDENGNLIEEGSSEGPPDWWAIVVPIIALIGVGGAIYFLLPLRPKRKET